MTNEIKKDLQFLPVGAIMKSLNINKETLLSYEEKTGIKPKIHNGKQYYSLNDLDKFRQTI